MIGSRYRLDAATRTWRSPDAQAIPYSDGAGVEARLLRAVEDCTDVSVMSRDLRARIDDWPSEYHFSAARANLVRPLGLTRGMRVLELGCGNGAITRALGELGAEVVAVEGSPARAAVAAARCRDLPNVKVVQDTIASLQLEGGFDVVTLIGVLEYAPVFSAAADPVGECLARATGFLADGGRLVVAIENQLGLKYFAGCAEDHLGRPFAGITGYGERTPMTFGRRELARRLQAAGLTSEAWLFPFPDYKLPQVVLSEAGLAEPRLNVADLLLRARSRDYAGSPVRAFDETSAWREVARNGLVADLANSFLVVARRTGATRAAPQWLAKAYATERRAAFATGTTIEAGGDGLVVRKARLYPDAAAEPLPVTQRLDPAPYCEGELLTGSLRRVLRETPTTAAIAAWARPWVDLLQSRTLAGRCLAAGDVDCTPFNVLRTGAGLAIIDAEWNWQSEIPLTWVLMRGLVNSLNPSMFGDGLRGMSYGAAVREVLRHLGIEVPAADWSEAARLEDELQHAVQGVAQMPWAQQLESPLPRLVDAFAVLGEAERLKSTVSWTVTKPLRLAGNLLSGRLFRRPQR